MSQPAADAVAYPPDPPRGPNPLPTTPRPYQQFLRTERTRWWHGVLALAALVLSFFVLSLVFGLLGGILAVVTGELSVPELRAQGSGLSTTPMLFLANNLALAALVPVSMLLQWAFFGVRPRWASSIAGGFRWRVLLRMARVVVPALAVYLVGLQLLGAAAGGLTWKVSVPLLLVVLLTTWAQSAGEEYGVRGLVARSVGSWFEQPRTAIAVSTILSSLLFMAIHLATDPWLCLYYFSFGVALSLVAWRTGGLETGCLIHATNNVLALTMSALFGGADQHVDRSAGSAGPAMLVSIAVVGLLTWAVLALARREGLPTRAAPGADPV